MSNPPPKTDVQWHEPARQARVAMLFIGLKYLRRAIRQAWPLFLIVFIRGGSEGQGFVRFLYLALAITGFQLISSIVAWFRFYFYIRDDELIVEQGIFSRKRSNIPLTRIQSLQFEQNVLHKQFKVVKVQVETAGSKTAELSLDALERTRAEDLRGFIMARKAEIQPAAELETGAERTETEDDGAEKAIPPSSSTATPLMDLPLRALLYVGLTRNHLRTAALIVGGLLGLYQLAGDILPLADPEQLTEKLLGIAPQTLWQSTLLLGGLLMAASLVGSVIMAGLRHYDLRLSSDEKGFHLTAGLLNRREQLMRHEKLQYLRTTMNLLQARLGLRVLTLLQVGGNAAAGQSITVPGCDEDALERIRRRIFPAEAEEGLVWAGIHPRIVRRYLLQVGVFPVLITQPVLWLNAGPWALLSLLWLGVAYLLGQRYYRNFRYGLNDRLLRVKSALLIRRETQLWLYKVQAVSVSQTFIQKRVGLADVNLSMAAGSVSIPYLPIATAHQLRDFFLYCVQITEDDWM